MRVDVVFVGTKFLYNEGLSEYGLREIKKEFDVVNSIIYFKDMDNSVFLQLEHLFNEKTNLFVFASRQNFATVSKIISTISEDNLELKDEVLIPSKVEIYDKQSYLVEYNGTKANIVLLDDSLKISNLYIKNENKTGKFQLFDENIESARVLFEPLSSTFDVRLEFVNMVDGWVEVTVSSKKMYGDITNFINSAKKLLPNNIIVTDNMFSYIIETLSSQNKTVTFAESCTGGLLTYMLTKNNGASKILNGSLVTYSNHLKENWLAVSSLALEEWGAVSSEVVKEMSEGALGVSEADFAVSVSGIAGDSGGSELKPVGTVYIGVRNKEKHIEEKFLFKGDRNYIQLQSALMGIKMLVTYFKESFFNE